MKENKLNIVILLVSLYLIDSAKFQITGSISPLTFHEQLPDIVVTYLCPIHQVKWMINYLCVFGEKASEMGEEEAVKI